MALEDFKNFSDIWSKIEGERLRWIERNQSHLRAECYKGLVDAVRNGDENADNSVGMEIRLPGTFPGAPRTMFGHYQDALAIVREYRVFTWFITYTCNPNHPDIIDNIFPHQSPNDRPDIVDRVFRGHTKEFFHDLHHKNIMGQHLANVHVFEQQLRSL